MTKPGRDAAADYDLAVDKRRRLAVKETLRRCRSRVLEAYTTYDQNLGVASKVVALDLKLAAKVALKENYRLTFTDAPLASIREEAFEATFRGLCPLCGKGEVSELDHYLPKSLYPEFSMLSWNLVPACERCNDIKSNVVGVTVDEGRFFHVFYDKVTEVEPLLKAELVVQGGVVARFRVNERLPEDVRVIASFHFDKLDLGTAYAAGAAIELLERFDAIASYHKFGGASEVERFAKGSAKSLRSRFGTHYWKAALYDGMVSSADFCSGGYQLLLAG
ncbi:HNH endonuclease [Micromonospora taraxaci]|uniref:HNH endonuclease n=1 Tax=Micromonospora taraxaci TaxID=1316803 RepID=UPI003C300BA3